MIQLEEKKPLSTDEQCMKQENPQRYTDKTKYYYSNQDSIQLSTSHIRREEEWQRRRKDPYGGYT